MLNRKISRLNCKGNLKRYALLGIPVLSIFALVGIASTATNPSLQQVAKQLFSTPKCSAVIDCESAPNSCPDGYHLEGSPICDCVADTTTEPTTPSTNATPSVSMIIDNNTIKDTIYTGRGTTAYASHTINISASNIEDYKLTLSPTKTLTGPSTIGNASGQKGSSLNANTWGYGWGSTSTADSDLTYNSLAASVNLTGDSVKDNKVDFSRKLAFAAKFSDSADDGAYSASINLTLTVTPRKVVFDGITTMQEMSAATCKNATVGDSTVLKDTRDSGINSYTIAKLSDNNCWMVNNLKLDLTKTGAATSTESDNLSVNWPTEALVNRFDTETTNTWETNSTLLAEFSKAPAKIYNTGDGKGYQPAYGYYYSWCAATGGTCGGATSNNTDASGSICPKNWQLPKGGTDPGTNNFAILMIKDGASLPNPLTTRTSISWSNNLDGTVPATMTLGNAKWYRPGEIDGNGLRWPGSLAGYWSRTASSNTNAYYLLLNTDNTLTPASSGARYYGLSVRCVAYSS